MNFSLIFLVVSFSLIFNCSELRFLYSSQSALSVTNFGGTAVPVALYRTWKWDIIGKWSLPQELFRLCHSDDIPKLGVARVMSDEVLCSDMVGVPSFKIVRSYLNINSVRFLPLVSCVGPQTRSCALTSSTNI